MASNPPEKIRKASCQQWKLLLRLERKVGAFYRQSNEKDRLHRILQAYFYGNKGETYL
jgi:hypothetical protein